MLFGTFLRFAPKNSRNKRFSDVFTQKINVVRLTTKTVFVSYLFLVDSIPGLSTATRKQEAVFESPQTQIRYWRTQQWKKSSMTGITVFSRNYKGTIDYFRLVLLCFAKLLMVFCKRIFSFFSFQIQSKSRQGFTLPWLSC